MRKRRLAYNTVSSLIYQITTIICGFIMPRLILVNFGSSVNGVVNSITQFLSLIAFLDLGVGAVIQSTLYKPLSENDYERVSEIAAAGEHFFRRIAIILTGYVLVLVVLYPFFIEDFPHSFSASLVVAMSISFFAQYYFGIFDRLLLLADQKGYIQYNALTITLIVNTICSAIVIQLGASIQVVRLTTSLIYVFRPVVLRIYVRRHYPINRKVTFHNDTIQQKWNGLSQHISFIVLENTDTIILTALSTPVNISIYSVYHMVIYGIKSLFTVLSSGLQSFWGDMWAKNEFEELRRSFVKTEWILHMGCVLLFGCTGCLIVPFILIFTSGVTDANYCQPVFALILTVAHGVHCLRIPYHILIKSVGHYKQTQNNYIIAMVLNLIISIVSVKLWGLIGVALGTFVSMFYQTISMEKYDSRVLLSRRFTHFLKLVGVDTIIVGVSSVIYRCFCYPVNSYFSWIVLGLMTSVVWFIVTVLVNLLFYRDYTKSLFRKMLSKVFR